MADPASNFKINLNQNLWVLIVSFLALGASEYWKLGQLQTPALVMAWVSAASVIVTLVVYTARYVLNKLGYPMPLEKSPNWLGCI